MKKALLILLASWISVSVFARNPEAMVITGTRNLQTDVQFTLPDWSFVDVLVNGQPAKGIMADGGVPLLRKGDPELPSFSLSVPVNATGAIQVNVLYGAYDEYPGIELAPSKGSLKRDVNPATVAFEYGASYSRNAFFPVDATMFGKPYIIRDARYVAVRAFPFQYNPVTKVLRVYHSMTINVISDPNQPGANELTEAAQRNGGGNDQLLYTPVGEDGGRMLIIGPALYEPSMQPLIDWKKQKGIETEYVTIESIGNTETNIYNYVDNYYSMFPALNFLLIAGDHQQVVSYDAGNSGSEIKWSDSEYGQLSGADKYPEIFVGRFSAQTTSELEVMVTRTLEYEKTPDMGSWYNSYIGIGSNQGAGYGDDGEADWEHMRNIGQQYMTYGGYATMYEFYDGSQGGNDASGNPNAAMVTTAVNTGAGQFYYCGHGAQNVCVTSNFGSTDVWAATNNNMYPFVVSVACNNGTFISGTCLTEDFLLANNTNGPTGAIAACGSSILMAWAEPMEVQDEMAYLLTETYPNNVKRTLGGMFYNGGMSMLDAYGNSSTAEEVMETWIMFGDPSVMIRTQTPTSLTVTHPVSQTVGATTMLVSSPTEGALVCITENNVILGTGYISGGSVTINLPPATPGTLLITVTAFNKTPYQAFIPVGPTGIAQNGGASNMNVFPNPANNFVNVDYFTNSDSPVSIEVVNVLGEVMYSAQQQQQAGQQHTRINTENIADGVYFLRITTETGSTTERLVIR